jgi:hypothetical protein
LSWFGGGISRLAAERVERVEQILTADRVRFRRGHPFFRHHLLRARAIVGAGRLRTMMGEQPSREQLRFLAGRLS